MSIAYLYTPIRRMRGGCCGAYISVTVVHFRVLVHPVVIVVVVVIVYDDWRVLCPSSRRFARNRSLGATCTDRVRGRCPCTQCMAA